MNIFRRSLAEDAVDRYNHTWSFMLLLVLSLVTWFLPLSPVLSPQSVTASENSHDTRSQAEALDNVPSHLQDMQDKPKYTAQCWCPSEFTSAMVKYTDAVCGSAFNQAVNGKDEDANYTLAASLYNIPLDMPIPINRSHLRFKPDRISTTEEDMVKGIIKDSNKHVDKNSSKEKAAMSSDIIYFTSVKTPLILFVFAVCLKLPHIIWTILSGCGGFNIDQTLQTAKAGQILNKDSREQLNRDLVHAISAKSASFSTSFLYLFFKLLMCVVAIASLVVVYNTLPDIQNLARNVNDQENNESTGQAQNLWEKTASQTNNKGMQSEQDYRNMPLVCEIKIRQLQAMQHFSIQCVFTPVDSSITNSMLRAFTGKGLPQASNEGNRAHLGIYEALYTILLAFFVVLAIINVLSLLIWSSKLLLSPCRGRVSSSTNLQVDIYLLLYMALENVGHLAAYDLAENFSRETRGGKTEEMQTLQ